MRGKNGKSARFLQHKKLKSWSNLNNCMFGRYQKSLTEMHFWLISMILARKRNLTPLPVTWVIASCQPLKIQPSKEAKHSFIFIPSSLFRQKIWLGFSTSKAARCDQRWEQIYWKRRTRIACLTPMCWKLKSTAARKTQFGEVRFATLAL